MSRRPLKVVLVHSFYRSENPSGENEIVVAHRSALEQRGHEVRLISVASDDLRDEPARGVRAAARVATGLGRSPIQAIRDAGADIVHVHNLFPNFSRRWVRDLDVPLVVTLHNFRSLCAAATLFRDGHVCTLCPDGARWSGFRYACYRDSHAATLPLTLSQLGGPARNPLIESAVRLIVMSERAVDVYAHAGVQRAKMAVVPSFVRQDLDPGLSPPPAGTSWLYVGRLDEQKGILRLIERWPPGFHLRVIGDGPLLHEVSRAALGSDVEVIGRARRSTVMRLMTESVGLVFPSLSYEGSPLVHAEALAAGLPVVAFAPNVVADVTRRFGTGMAVGWDDDLADVLEEASSRFPDLRRRCRRLFEERYSEPAFVRRIENVYEAALLAGRP